ncbi:putative quinol monooxygenase [Hydromonas duriensis]|uniref:putative quinol monooxygenase n=1 Tax=Hydromonas duriensis TaxID=1527608 RepID=UPI002482A091|nr:putative quinol monooxygenase [Hydromonas duriensis]
MAGELYKALTNTPETDAAFYVTGRFKVKSDKLAEAIALMKSLTEATNAKEEGCLEYYYLQSATNSYEFSSIEIWKNETEEVKHWQTEHVQHALSKLPELLEGQPDIVKWHAVR